MKKGLKVYLADRWNVFDVSGLFLATVGLVLRGLSEESGRGWYALSAPLFFSRILFFAQILRFQGPMIEVGVYCSTQYTCPCVTTRDGTPRMDFGCSDPGWIMYSKAINPSTLTSV